MRFLKSIPALLLAVSLLPLQTNAGTTGGIVGRVVDSATQAPVAGVVVTANAPTETATSVTDANGTYRFLSLGPDTYTLTFTKNGYDPLSQPGLSVFADQVQTVNVALVKTLKTIARVTSQAAANLVKSGQTSDVYSVNAAGQAAAQGLTGPGSLNNAYGAIASVPGVALNQGEQGWWQELHIRGGDIDQVGFELDGIPVNRVYDNAPETMLSSLGSQEVQVYTGGVPAGSDAQGISGYVNQVVKTGTYPGYGTAMLSAGYPAFYHQASVEVGGSTPDRLFSYYVGFGGSNQSFHYIDNNDGASIPNSFFYPVSFVPGWNCHQTQCNFQKYTNGLVYTGAPSPLLATTGMGYGLINQTLRDNIVNLHFKVPHKLNGLQDDVQAFWMTSENHNDYASSTNDFGANVVDAIYGPSYWDDTYGYSGAPMQPVDTSKIYKYFFPQSQVHAFQSLLPTSLRDPNENGVSVSKLQYQHVFSPSEFLRVYGYSLYSTWFINGYNATAQPYYGWELPYFLPDHVYGFNLSYENQLSSQHLLTVSGAYTYSNPERYDVTYYPSGWPVTNLVGKNNDCYAPTSDNSQGIVAGQQIGCYADLSIHSGSNPYTYSSGRANNPTPDLGYDCKTAPATPACVAGAQWIVTNTSFHGALNQVRTAFSGYSIGDQWRPDDKWNVNLGMRLEDFQFNFGNTQLNDPARQFWFTKYNQEFCFAPNVNSNKPVLRGNNGLGLCPSGTNPLAIQPQDPAGTSVSVYGPLVNANGGQYTAARFEPRLGVTYTVDPLSVLRASFGIYARPPNSSWVQYNTLEQNLPAYLGSHFYGFGFNSPNHIIRPDTSYNYDLSWEHRFKGSNVSFKISPFYRSTRDQLQNFFIDPQGGLESGLNVGQQVTDGVEAAVQMGDFSRDGLSGQLAFTYTHSQIRYQNFQNSTQNVINQLNNYIQQYNAYTGACAPGGKFYGKSQYGQALCGATVTGVASSPCYFTAQASSPYAPASCGAPGALKNPYYGAAAQNLFNPTAWYTTYDIIPGPVSAENGYAVPYVTSMILNYKHQKFSITNSWSYSSGATYGGPAAWPGYAPDSCNQPHSKWVAAHGINPDPAACTGLLFIPDSFSGVFDNLGSFIEPWRLQMGIALQYDVSPKVTARLNFTNILDVCGQRGYKWDNPNVCVYSAPPTGFFYPAGNWYPNHASSVPPPQMQYPYDFFFNGANTGFLGVTEPLQITGSIQIKL